VVDLSADASKYLQGSSLHIVVTSRPRMPGRALQPSQQAPSGYQSRGCLSPSKRGPIRRQPGTSRRTYSPPDHHRQPLFDILCTSGLKNRVIHLTWMSPARADVCHETVCRKYGCLGLRHDCTHGHCCWSMKIPHPKTDLRGRRAAAETASTRCKMSPHGLFWISWFFCLFLSKKTACMRWNHPKYIPKEYS